MNTKCRLFILSALLTGCVSTQPPSLPANSPTNAEAPAPNHTRRSVLVADDTTRAINKRLHESSATPEQGDMQKMQHEGDGMKGMKMDHDMSGVNMAAPSPSGKAQPDSGSYYTCVMHPKVHQDKPGNCPICGMKLVKKEAVQKDQ